MPLQAEIQSERGKRTEEKDVFARVTVRAGSAEQPAVSSAHVNVYLVSAVSTIIYRVYVKSEDTAVVSLADRK